MRHVTTLAVLIGMPLLACDSTQASRGEDEKILADPPSASPGGPGLVAIPHESPTPPGEGEPTDDGDAAVDAPAPRVLGTLSKEAITQVIGQHKEEIRLCYETELASNPNLQGRIVTRWTIEATGAVTQAEVASTTMQHREVESCIVGRIKSWRFPEPEGGGVVEVNYPFVFRAG